MRHSLGEKGKREGKMLRSFGSLAPAKIGLPSSLPPRYLSTFDQFVQKIAL